MATASTASPDCPRCASLQRQAQLLQGHGMLMQAKAGQLMLELQLARAEVATLVQTLQPDEAAGKPVADAVMQEQPT